jgi:hypothetical protein
MKNAQGKAVENIGCPSFPSPSDKTKKAHDRANEILVSLADTRASVKPLEQAVIDGRGEDIRDRALAEVDGLKEPRPSRAQEAQAKLEEARIRAEVLRDALDEAGSRFVVLLDEERAELRDRTNVEEADADAAFDAAIAAARDAARRKAQCRATREYLDRTTFETWADGSLHTDSNWHLGPSRLTIDRTLITRNDGGEVFGLLAALASLTAPATTTTRIATPDEQAGFPRFAPVVQPEVKVA